MRSFLLMILVSGWFGMTIAQAVEPLDLLSGYDKVRWGQSSTKIQGGYDNKLTAQNNARGLATAKDLPGDVEVFALGLWVYKPPVAVVKFLFLEDRLCAVVACFDMQTSRTVTNQELTKVIWEKYYADAAVRDQLEHHQIVVRLADAERRVEPPKGPEDLLPAVSHPGRVSDVVYENRELWEQQLAKAQDRKRREDEKAAQAASEASLKEAL